MRNFYYVTTFNLHNPVVKTMLNKQGITSMTGMIVDFKLRSKLFLSFTEATLAANDDFNNKLEAVYPDKEEHNISQFSVANPAILSRNNEMITKMAEKFGGKSLEDWDSNCCSVVFFVDNPEQDDDINLDPNSWMFKYEIFFTEDAIELSGNGDFVFSKMNVPHTEFRSTYH